MLKSLVNIVSKNKAYHLNISFQPLNINLRTFLQVPVGKSSYFDLVDKTINYNTIYSVKRFGSTSTADTIHCETTLNKERKIKMAVTPNVIFVLGGPGAGKGTQCGLIVENFGFIHLSAGDLLREERNNPGSEFGELIEKHIRDGTIVPVEITCSLIEKAMIKSGQKNFLIDGFPRNQNNLDGWNTQMDNKVNILFVLFIDCPQEICVSRCLERGQAGSGRSDDNPESLKKRVITYMNDTVPIVNYFEGKQLVRKVNASKGPSEVFDEVKAHFANISSLL